MMTWAELVARRVRRAEELQGVMTREKWAATCICGAPALESALLDERTDCQECEDERKEWRAQDIAEGREP